MDLRRHQIIEGLVDEAVPCQLVVPAEAVGDDGYAEMTAATGRPGMAGMPMGIIDDIQVLRSEGASQAFAY